MFLYDRKVERDREEKEKGKWQMMMAPKWNQFIWLRQTAYAKENVNIKIFQWERDENEKKSQQRNYFEWKYEPKEKERLFVKPPVAGTTHAVNHRTKWLNVLFYLNKFFYS